MIIRDRFADNFRVGKDISDIKSTDVSWASETLKNCIRGNSSWHKKKKD
jgi:hypothetical protein